MDPLTLTAQLNALLQAIHLPFVLESPVDLTPSLLIAVLESILNVRIPIAHVLIDENDKDHVADGRVTPSQNRHIQTMKVFLGVLETDILQTDVGLSKLDPRLLAAGAWDEVVYVAEVLCWIGEELGLIPPVPVVDKGKQRAQDQHDEAKIRSNSPALPLTLKVPTPSPSSTITFLPPFSEVSPPPTPTTTTLLFATDLEDHTLQTNITSPLITSSSHHQLPSPSTVSHSSPHKLSNSKPKRHTKSRSTHLPSSTQPHIHSRLRSSSLFSTSVRNVPQDDRPFSRQSPPIRRTGYISLIDHEAELSSFFEHSLSIPSSSLPPSPLTPSPILHMPQRQTSPKHKPKARSHQVQLETPAVLTSSSAPLTSPSTPRRSNDDKDWKTLLSTSPDHDPRRTYELLQQRTQLMEELLHIRMNQRQPFQ